ncbi:MAG: alpha/beta hydrolase [Ahniella sp.]|nr:alpha/beta hydrolase [Ahniella sp.]
MAAWATVCCRAILAVVMLGGTIELGAAGGGSGTLYSKLPQVSAGTIERLTDVPWSGLPERPVDVWMPPGYPDQAPYAVLYMHDGQMLFDAEGSWNRQEWQVDEVASRLQESGAVRPFIVVAVHNLPASRHAEYQPQQPFETLSEAAREAQMAQRRDANTLLYDGPVRSDQYVRFLVHGLKPLIDRRYAVSPDAESTMIMGSSMGGLVSWYAMLRYPGVFGAAACLSTHWPGGFPGAENPLDDALIEWFGQHLPKPGNNRFWFDHGTATLDALYGSLQTRADAALGARLPGGGLAYGCLSWRAHEERAARRGSCDSCWAARPPKTNPTQSSSLWVWGRSTLVFVGSE